MMNNRAEFYSVSPKIVTLLMSQEQQLALQFSQSESLSSTLLELVKLRVSQINRCAYCIDMHTKEAFKNHETAERIIGLSAWGDMLCYSEQERAALSWAELVISDQVVTDQAYSDAVSVLGEQGIVDLTFAVNAINSWNRVSKVFKPEVGSYKVA